PFKKKVAFTATKLYNKNIDFFKITSCVKLFEILHAQMQIPTQNTLISYILYYISHDSTRYSALFLYIILKLKTV
ncbi:hypothetical protein EQB08_15645, partial [Listeria monocytogenes]|nr:hypothetical protein [Listeria monocytogenes]